MATLLPLPDIGLHGLPPLLQFLNQLHQLIVLLLHWPKNINDASWNRNGEIPYLQQRAMRSHFACVSKNLNR